MANIIRIQMDHPRFPRRLYLAASLIEVERLFPNAFIFYRVKWDRLKIMREHPMFPLPAGAPDPKINYHEHIFSKQYPWTIIPFSSIPSPNGNRRQIAKNDLSRILSINKTVYTDHRRQFKRLPQELKDLISSRPKPVGGFQILGNNPGALLIEASERMSIKLNGALYNTPCEMCSNLFAHIARNCEIRVDAKARATFCHMKLMWDSDNMVEPTPQVVPSKLAPLVMGTL